MRTLFSFIGGGGHFEPLVPFARAALAAGHAVAFCCSPAMAPMVAAVGFRVLTLDTGAVASAPTQRAPLRPLDQAREEAEFRDRFARAGAASRAPLVIAQCQSWLPDVIVCDEADFGAMVAAEALGIPHATVLVIAAGSFVRADLVGAALDELRAAYGLPPDPAFAMPGRHLVLSPIPPSFRDPAFPLPATGHSFRPAALAPPPADAPPIPTGDPAMPTIYLTLGTVFNMESGDLFQRALAGLRALPTNLIVTVGNEIDPEEFGPQPPHVHIARYIPQAAILPRCAAVISHGGSGSVVGALAHGLPIALLPMGADQLLNAARCVDLGVGLSLDPLTATAEDIGAAAMKALRDPAYRQAARCLRDEAITLQGAEAALPLIEAITKEASLH